MRNDYETMEEAKNLELNRNYMLFIAWIAFLDSATEIIVQKDAIFLVIS